MYNSKFNVRYDTIQMNDRPGRELYGYIYDPASRKQKKWNTHETSQKKALEVVKRKIEEIYGQGQTIADVTRYQRELTVSIVLDRYMQEHYIPKNGTKKTPFRNRRNITSQWSLIRQINSVLGNKVAKSLTKDDLNHYISKRREIVSDVTIGRELRILKAALNKILPNHTAIYVRENIKGHADLRKGKPRPAYIKDEHHKMILKELQEIAPNLIPIIKICHWCGARSDEIKSLRWHEIDWEEMRINLPPERNKEGRAKSIVLNEECILELLNLKENRKEDKKGRPLSKYVFNVSEKYFYEKWNEACQNLGFLEYDKTLKSGRIKSLYLPHDYRHTRVVDNENAGIPRGLTKMQTGHASDATYWYYDTKPQEHQEQIIDLQEKYYKEHKEKLKRKKSELKKKLERIRNTLDYWKVDLPEKAQADFKSDLNDLLQGLDDI